MKAYLVRRDTPLPPFAKSASQLALRDCTVGARLRRQLSSAGLEVVECIEPPEHIAVASLVLDDSLVVSDSFLPRLLEALRGESGNRRVEVNAARMPLLNTQDPQPSFAALPLTFYGAPRSPEDVRPLRMTPPTLHTMDDGLPDRIGPFDHVLRVHFLDWYALDLVHWFDLLTATSLYCREHVSNNLRSALAFVPRRVVPKVFDSPFLMQRTNVIGKNCRIHPTAILEGCVVGDNVEIGPFCYLRSSVISDDVVIRERASVKMSFLGRGAFLMTTDIINSYIGAGTAVFTLALYNIVFGERGFIGGGSGFADFIVGAEQIPACIDGKEIPSGQKFLGSALGDDCFVGANLIFAPGRTIPDGTRILDHGLIKNVPQQPGGAFVRSRDQLLQIPDNFVGART